MDQITDVDSNGSSESIKLANEIAKLDIFRAKTKIFKRARINRNGIFLE